MIPHGSDTLQLARPDPAGTRARSPYVRALTTGHAAGADHGTIRSFCGPGARILAEIGDSSAFANGSKLAVYADLVLVTRPSGASLGR